MSRTTKHATGIESPKIAPKFNPCGRRQEKSFMLYANIADVWVIPIRLVKTTELCDDPVDVQT